MSGNDLRRTGGVVEDGRPGQPAEDERAARVADGLATIKAHMPLTYADIQAKAAGPLGREVFVLVRRALRGEPNCFYAIEGGHVVGAPFDAPALAAEVLQYMRDFGVGFLVMWSARDSHSPSLGEAGTVGA